MAQSWLHRSLENHDATLGTLRRARVLKVDDSGPQQLVDLQGLAADFPQKLVRLQPHGFSSNPPLQSEGLLKSLGGRSDRGMFFGGEHYDYRPRNLPSGNSVLYDDKGNVVWAKGSGGVTIQTAAGPINLTSVDKVSITAQGDILVNPNGKKVYLGGDPGKDIFAKVMTESGASPTVYAKIG